MNEKKFHTGEVAKRYNVTRRTVEYWVKTGKLRPWRKSTNEWYKFTLEELERFEMVNRHQSLIPVPMEISEFTDALYETFKAPEDDKALEGTDWKELSNEIPETESEETKNIWFYLGPSKKGPNFINVYLPEKEARFLLGMQKFFQDLESAFEQLGGSKEFARQVKENFDSIVAANEPKYPTSRKKRTRKR